jgi:DEAD/DEAH box helicase domain-containing protein
MNALLPLLSRWRSDPDIGGNIYEWRTLPAREAQFRPFPGGLHPALAQAMHQRGIQDLYLHQEQAWHAAADGSHLVIVTGTASGKTLSYNLPVLDRMVRDPEARALYIFPTKALAQDQTHDLQEWSRLLESLQPGMPGIGVGAYDGDTPSAARPGIRAKARAVITNPDMLHTGILPHHTRWAEFFQHLEFVIIDEVHTYRGVFGSHVANVIRRLKRVCQFYGASPRFILTSATIGNPQELANHLIEADTRLIDQDGSARGPRHFLIYNPPLLDKNTGLRRSSLHESVRLAEDLLAYNVQTILFARSRRTVELILTYLRERAGGKARAANVLSGELPADDQPEAIRGYRSGYLAGQRRTIERGLREGQVRAVVATTALELGIDIGGMGASVLVGYPGSIAGAWQQAGRAGRGRDPSLALMVTTADPLDQFLARHPEYFFDRSPENGLINPNNLLILLAHLRCAAFEIPFRQGEQFGDVDPALLGEFLSFLENEGVLHHSGEKYFWMADQYPAQAISLRSASVDNVILQSWSSGVPTTLGQVDRASALWMVHPQAVYLHEGETYLVEELDLEANQARLRRTQTDYYTEPQRESIVTLLEKQAEEPVLGAVKAYGEIQVNSQVTGYRKIRWHTHETLGLGPLDLPPSELQTIGYWIALEEATVDRLRAEGLWTNDPNDYGPNWPRQRERARQRDGFRCQVCGALELGRQHDVHHKTPFRMFQSAEQANLLENLLTLCHSCHRQVETAVRVRSGLAGLGYVLWRLAPLFLMCDAGDLGLHTDPQSPLAEGQPAVTIFELAPAGVGFSARLFEIHAELITRARELTASCECADGCPSCVGPGGENGMGGKRETLAILEALDAISV